jgi:hypothetical protein
VTVWVVFHSDIEDDRYIRGIYATPRLAAEALARPEHLSFPASRWREAWTRDRPHSEFCCAVEDWTVVER